MPIHGALNLTVFLASVTNFQNIVSLLVPQNALLFEYFEKVIVPSAISATASPSSQRHSPFNIFDVLVVALVARVRVVT